MKILIFGVAGMLGHKIYQMLTPVFDVTGTIRGDYYNISRFGFFRESDIIPNINALKIYNIEGVLEKITPSVVVNCIGIVKSVSEAQERLPNIWVNSLFPHQLYEICKKRKIRLIHISTDCVFSGRKGNYQENDVPDAEDIYGKTKYLGEVSGEGSLTIRTSLIGRELETSKNLVEWFLSNQGGRLTVSQMPYLVVSPLFALPEFWLT